MHTLDLKSHCESILEHPALNVFNDDYLAEEVVVTVQFDDAIR